MAEIGAAQVTLLCYSDDPAPPWLPAEVSVRRLAARRASRMLPGLIGYLRAEQPDVLIARQMHANFIALAAASLARAPGWRGKLVLVQDHLVELTHADNWRDNKWLARACYRFADGVIAPSPTVCKDVARWCRLDPATVGLVPNPIPKYAGALRPPPHPWLADGQPPVFVNVGRMIPLKRADLLIDAFAELRRKHRARLLILGDGPMRRPSDEQIGRLGLSGDAQTLGWIDDPLPFAAAAHALVHSSDEDGFAQVLTEAMSAGCAVITTDAQGGGPRFVTGDGEYGLLVPRADRAALADAMEQMLHPQVRRHFAERGYQRAEQLSPAASGRALAGFLTGSLGIRQ